MNSKNNNQVNVEKQQNYSKEDLTIPQKSISYRPYTQQANLNQYKGAFSPKSHSNLNQVYRDNSPILLSNLNSKFNIEKIQKPDQGGTQQKTFLKTPQIIQQQPKNNILFKQNPIFQNPNSKFETMFEDEGLQKPTGQILSQKPPSTTVQPTTHQEMGSFATQSILDEGINREGFDLHTTKNITASKQEFKQKTLPQAIGKIQTQTPQIDNFVIKNKDTGEVFDLNEYRMVPNEEANQFLLKSKNTKPLQKTNQDISLWLQKVQINNEFLLMAKINNSVKCLEFLDKSRGDYRADIFSKNQDDFTCLHFASINGNSKLVCSLLYHGAIIDAMTKQEQTALNFSAQKGFDEILQVLINAGAEINHPDSDGNTSLHHASMNDHKRIIETLLKRPSLGVQRVNKNQQTAAMLAKDEEIKKIFDNFFNFQKQSGKNGDKLLIQNTVQDNISKMFNHLKTNPNQQQFLEDSAKLTQNKISINSDKTTDERNSGSFNEELSYQSFKVHGLIGKGSFGEVYLVEKKSTSMLYAMKVLYKSKVMKHNLTKYAITERNVLSLTNHTFIVKMIYAFQTPDKLFLILDYCPGGDLGELLQKEKKLSEFQVRIYLAEIILALEDLHKRDVIFRDLKPDNIVIDHEGHALLTDFGLSKEGVLEHNTGARSFCGSVAYLAPEMLKRQGHGKAVDWYLLGVVMYELLVGIPPYYANNREELFNNIEKAPLKLPTFLSVDAKSLLKALLQRNPAKRLGSGKSDAEEVKVHKFFQSIEWGLAEQRKLKPPIFKRKIKISTKYDPNIFEITSPIEEGKEKIEGWSFVAPNFK